MEKNPMRQMLTAKIVLSPEGKVTRKVLIKTTEAMLTVVRVHLYFRNLSKMSPEIREPRIPVTMKSPPKRELS